MVTAGRGEIVENRMKEPMHQALTLPMPVSRGTLYIT